MDSEVILANKPLTESAGESFTQAAVDSEVNLSDKPLRGSAGESFTKAAMQSEVILVDMVLAGSAGESFTQAVHRGNKLPGAWQRIPAAAPPGQASDRRRPVVHAGQPPTCGLPGRNAAVDHSSHPGVLLRLWGRQQQPSLPGLRPCMGHSEPYTNTDACQLGAGYWYLLLSCGGHQVYQETGPKLCGASRTRLENESGCDSPGTETCILSGLGRRAGRARD